MALLRPTTSPVLLLAFLVCAAPARAQQAAPLPGSAAGAQVGVAAAVRGNVQVSSGGAVGTVLQSGQPVFLGQTISTGPGAGLQILLLDETVFTIGPNASLAIDEFVYDPRSHDGKVAARIVQGAFRFVTGKIARKNPEDMEVKLPAGTIGIRGTIAAGLVSGMASKIVLLGPGPKNNTGDPPGKITIDNADREVALTRPGFGTEISGSGAAPADPFHFSIEEIAAISGALAAEPLDQPEAPEGEDAGSTSEEAGQLTAEAFSSLLEVAGISELSEDLGQDAAESAQNSANATTTVADGVATLDQLRTVDTGVFHYVFGSDPGSAGIGQFTQTVKNGSAVSIVGNLTGDIQIDFGARTVGGGESFFGADTSANGGDISGEVDFPSHSFASGAGNAAFTSTVSSRTGTFTVNNSGGVVGQTATFEVSYDSTATDGFASRDIGSSNPVTVTREDGAVSN